MDVTIKNKVALVTGSSSGMGFATAITMARAGIHTYASMRNIKKSKTITELARAEKLPLQVIQLDVNDKKSVKEAITKIVTEKERIDVLVNNAGYGLFGSLEDLSLEKMKAQFETNFFGVIHVIQLVLPIMIMQKFDIIVKLTSVWRRIELLLLYEYQSTKFAL